VKPLLALAAVAAALTVTGPAQATNECDSFMSCIPVAGPWVAIAAPAAAHPFPSTRWQMRCPVGVVGGLDAELSDRGIDLTFPGLLGAPVNPGITTKRTVLFQGLYAGGLHRPTSYRPHIGCIPAAGGQRTPTALGVFPPSSPTVLRVRTLKLLAGRLLRATHGCAPGERLISSSTAVGFLTPTPPTPALVAGVRLVAIERAGRLLVSASRPLLPAAVGVEVQLQALCARGAPGP
jgi:hypothetical protein